MMTQTAHAATEQPSRVMLDIETMALDNARSLVLSLAVTPFTLRRDGPSIGAAAVWFPSLREQIALGRTIDEKTRQWWAEQPEVARLSWVHPVTGETILGDLGIEMAAAGVGSDTEVWANGIVFDIGNLDNLLRSARIRPPWEYNRVRDARTIYALAARRTMPDVTYVKHRPQDDNMLQIWRLWEHWPEEFES